MQTPLEMILADVRAQVPALVAYRDNKAAEAQAALDEVSRTDALLKVVRQILTNDPDGEAVAPLTDPTDKAEPLAEVSATTDPMQADRDEAMAPQGPSDAENQLPTDNEDDEDVDGDEDEDRLATIKRRLARMEPGTVAHEVHSIMQAAPEEIFTAEDLNDVLASRNVGQGSKDPIGGVRNALSRLQRGGLIERAERGKFYFPKPAGEADPDDLFPDLVISDENDGEAVM